MTLSTCVPWNSMDVVIVDAIARQQIKTQNCNLIQGEVSLSIRYTRNIHISQTVIAKSTKFGQDSMKMGEIRF